MSLMIPLVTSLIAIGFAGILYRNILKTEQGNSKMQSIAQSIREGAQAYLNKQYKIVSLFFFLVFVLLLIKVYFIDLTKEGIQSLYIPFSFLSGGFFSALAGYIGMKTATHANHRTAQAAQKSLNQGLRVAFNSGSVMGMSVVGMGLFHVSLWYWILGGNSTQSTEEMSIITNILVTSGLGASFMALFARVGGGIFTKAADVGADLVGKVESGIPEDDPRNPATIADNVGDNVGDVAGMGADLYESYIGSIVATMTLAAVSFSYTEEGYFAMVISPLVLASIGIVSSILGSFFVKTSSSNPKSLLWALRKGIYSASVLVLIGTFCYVEFFLLPLQEIGWLNRGIFFAIIIGLIAGNLIGYFTEYYTSFEYQPTKTLAEQSQTGPATLIIGGIALGNRSTVIPVITIVFAIIGAFFVMGGEENAVQGLYGIGMAAVGMLSTLGITLATDAYGPVADNAGGIAEMSGLPKETRDRTDALDALGNTTAATGKGFAIGSAALTALTLLVAYTQNLSQLMGRDINPELLITDPLILIGLFLGAMLPFLFSSLTMNAVGRSASAMVEEVRRQFREIPGILEGKAKPDYSACVRISTQSAQREMIAPALVAVITPLLIGILFGVQTVVALLAGSLVSGFILAIMMANTGGAWDNAKKYIEQGAFGGKGSDCHKAAVIGDTVGDPFKDTSGPSINILLKLLAMISIIFASAVIQLNQWIF